MHPSINFEDNPIDLNPVERANWIVVLPLGAYEQHGPHLPFNTDNVIVSGLLERIKIILPFELPVTFMPVESIGYSIEHMNIQGTKTFSYVEAIERWLGIAQQVRNLGIRKFVILNAHGGNSAIISIVITEARVRFSMLAAATSWTRLNIDNEGISSKEREIGIHGGEMETSLMLALKPHLVKMDLAQNFFSRQGELLEKFKYLRAYGLHPFGWMMTDLNPQGVVGNATTATPEKGEQLISHISERFIEYLKEIHIFDLKIID
ncbi:Creatinine amidohydrolase [Liberibacter crescens BT-1]|uniref:Creatinine amidohydrolase n=2 Tax=Liberibacter crescens TaxID=1273132 RepID=L0EWG6_LIBCB|nr:creatininase family protein [Liberibacter crescens]AGA65190.1 Creatinine amidohydrolase [Liberibacter crescens BT-1]AMC13146.1 creatininase [Liberibacter crescens]